MNASRDNFKETCFYRRPSRNRNSKFVEERHILFAGRHLLRPIRISKQCFKRGHDWFVVRIERAANTIALALFLSAFCVVDNSLAESASLPGIQEPLKNIELKGGGILVVGGNAFPMRKENVPNFSGRVDPFLAAISADSKPIANPKASEKGYSAEQRRRENSENDWVQVAVIPLFWFLVGIALGGGFGAWRRNR
jgi:hypothetical protein